MKYFLYISMFFLPFIVLSQENIALKTIPFATENLSISITQVLDIRKEKNLGLGINKHGEKVIFQLSPDAPTAILNFMKTSFSQTKDAKPIVIKIKDLEIQQSQSSISHIKTRVYINLVFYEKENDTLQKLFDVQHNEDKTFAISDKSKIFETYEQNIRAALEYCALSFINTYKKRSKPEFISGDLQTNERDVFYEKSEMKYKKRLGKWFDMLTFKKVYSKHKEGWKISYIGFADSDKDFIMPFVLSYDRYSIKRKSLLDKNYRSVDAFSVGGGFDGYLKIIPGVYANIGLEVPLGLEITKNTEGKKQHNFLIGIGAKQGIKIIPWKNYGIVIGAGVFQQIQTSKVYTRNFGFELELGINF
ncbi:hypothetical protein ATO12_04295 [Aquimarina atlantica]|uniref:Uncharacterized protein n=1 Tax=Aquimarina atlantica TaxID=1317122 RepID=A0A023C135_9FLAO|nr:hypothetical protein [Aquimarina atlantica]EZH76016.1 hypothetical protein ATO12_04295 [Aquimarina atlantica]